MQVNISTEGKLNVLRLIDGLTPERFTIQDEAVVVINSFDFIELTPALDPLARCQLEFDFKE
jgi:hypothetical protein